MANTKIKLFLKKIVFAGFFTCMTEQRASRPNIAGILDSTFGTDGVVTLQFRSLYANGSVGFYPGPLQSVSCIDAQRRLIITVNNLGYICVARVLENGDLDATFGGGMVSTIIPDITEEYPEGLIASAQAITLDRTGKILVVGSVFNTDKGDTPYFHTCENNDIVVLRYNYDGSLDTTFGEQGIIRISLNIGFNQIYSVICDSKDRITIAGANIHRIDNYYSSKFLLLRLLPDGSLDRSFGVKGNGFITGSYGYSSKPLTRFIDEIKNLKCDTYNRIISVGTSAYIDINPGSFGAQNYTVLVRYNEDGSFDQTFGAGDIHSSKRQGFIKVNTSPLVSGGLVVDKCDFILDKLGRIIATSTGVYSLPPINGIHSSRACGVVMRFLENGKLDRTFGKKSDNGIVRVEDSFALSNYYNTIAIDTDVKENLLVLGSWGEGENRLSGFMLSRVLPNGTFDTGFGANKTGKVLTALATGEDYIRAYASGLRVDASGRIIAWGIISNGAFSESLIIKVILVRYTSDYEYLFS